LQRLLLLPTSPPITSQRDDVLCREAQKHVRLPILASSSSFPPVQETCLARICNVSAPTVSFASSLGRSSFRESRCLPPRLCCFETMRDPLRTLQWPREMQGTRSIISGPVNQPFASIPSASRKSCRISLQFLERLTLPCEMIRSREIGRRPRRRSEGLSGWSPAQSNCKRRRLPQTCFNPQWAWPTTNSRLHENSAGQKLLDLPS
jgi:hypothetical protein